MKLDWKRKRELQNQKIFNLGYDSIHKYRIEKSNNYNEYCKLRNTTLKSKGWYNKRNKIDIDNLNDRYIKELIVKSKGIDVKNITSELIEIYRLQLQLKREIRNARKT